MSKYTTEVRYICEHAAGFDNSQDGSNVEQVIQAAIPVIFTFTFPIFDEAYRNVLQTKILKHFYTREIGLETVGLWKLKLNAKLNEIMPYYNQLYKSQLLEFNPFYDVDLTRTYTRKNDGTQDMKGAASTSSFQDMTSDSTSDATSDGTDKQTTTRTGTTTKKDAYSDTPQGALTDVETMTYLSNARIINDGKTETDSVDGTSGSQTETNTHASDQVDLKSDTDTTANTKISNLETYTETVKGKQGTQNYNDLLLKFRETFLNIDMQVINDLNELFLNLW